MDNTVEEQSAEQQSGEQQPAEPKTGKMNRKTVIYAAAAVIIVAGALLFYFFYLQNPVLAKVNDEIITVKEFNKEVAKVEPPLIRDMFREDPGKLLDRMIVKALLLQEAKKQGVSAPVQT